MRDNIHPDGRITAEYNETGVLYWLNRFGGLTTRLLARLHWPGKTSGMRMAQRTINRLKSQKLVLERRLFTGGCIYVLSERGAHLLRDQGVENISARGHRDLKFDKPMHRMIANDFVIDKYLKGYRIWTEFEVQRGLSPLPDIYVTVTTKKGEVRRRKIPDAVIEWESTLSWIEVENAWKSRSRLAQLMQVADVLLSSKNGYEILLDEHSAWFDEMIFVLPNDANFRSVARAISNSNLPIHSLFRMTLTRVNMSSGLVWQGETYQASASTILHHMKGL